MRAPCVARDAGMTLVELLVVLAVLALLGGLLTAGLHTAAAGWQRLARHNTYREELGAVHSLLHGLLSEAYLAKLDNSSGMVRFDGQPDRVEFLAPLPQRFGARDIVLYTLNFEPDGRLHFTWRLDRPSTGAGDVSSQSTDESIADFLDGSFLYYGQLDGTGELRWSKLWQGQRALPRLIKINFNWWGRRQEWVVAPLVTGAFCVAASSEVACSN